MWDWLVCWIIWAVKTMGSIITDVFTLVIGAIIQAANVALGLLPTFSVGTPTLDGGLIGNLNYFIPFGPLLVEFSAFIGAWILYRIYQYVLKWAKADV